VASPRRFDILATALPAEDFSMARPSRSRKAKPAPVGSDEERLIDAALALAARQGWREDHELRATRGQPFRLPRHQCELVSAPRVLVQHGRDEAADKAQPARVQ